MLAFTIRRLLIAIPIFFGITLLSFVIATTNPNGGALQAYIGTGHQITNSQLQAIKHHLGLDQPVPTRYVLWLEHFFQGDLGISQTKHEAVTEAIGAAIGPSLLLGGTAYLIQLLLAIPLGIYSAIRRGSIFDQFFTVLSYVLFSLPTFWFGLISIVVFGVALRWFPFGDMVNVRTAGGYGSVPYWAYFHAHTIAAVIDIAQHMILPVTILATVGMATDSRFMRAQMLEVLGQDYVRTARAKGLSERSVIGKHALRNALLPMVTNIGLTLPGLLGGAVVTETIFSWPGVGKLYINAAQLQDVPIVVAFVVLIGSATLIANILTDIAYGIVDPRIRLG